MKLRQKLAMLMAATIITSTMPTLTSAIQILVNKESMLMSNEFGYMNTAADKEAINLQINNNNNDPMKASHDSPIQFQIKGLDIKFDEKLYAETKGDNTFSEDVTLNDYEGITNDTVYALTDYSKDSDLTDGELTGKNASYVGYADRIFAIDKDGNYTSYVSIPYAQRKSYLRDSTPNTNYIQNPAGNVTEIFMFQKVAPKESKKIPFGVDKEPLYINVVPNNGKTDFVRNTGSITPFNPNAGDMSGLITAGKTDFTFTTDLPNTQLYLKDFTIFRDNYGDDSVLDVEFYQNFSKGLNERLYVPVAFRVSGKAPALDVDGKEIYSNKLVISSNPEVSGDIADINLKRDGQLSVDGKGELGIFEIEENQEFVFDGEFSTDDYSIDMPDILDQGTDGAIFHLQLSDSDLAFDLREGDRLWNEKATIDSDTGNITKDGEPGALAGHIQLTGGLRGFDNYIQVEILAAEHNEVVLRIIDETNRTTGINRKYEGGIEFHNLPIELESRHTELSLGDVELSITQVDPDSLEEGDKVGHLDFKDADEIQETLTIAEVIDDNVLVEILDEAELYAGQDSDTIEIAIQEIVGGAINPRDEFFFKLNNGKLDPDLKDNLESITFKFEGGEVQNDDQKIFSHDDDEEYTLDLDELYDACEGIYFQEDTANADAKWHQILEELTFELKVRANAGTKAGDMTVTVESDNFKDEEKTVVVGNIKTPFTVTAEPVYLDLGVKEQKTGKIVLKETAAEMFRDGHEIIIELEDIGLDSRSFDDGNVFTDEQSGLEIDTDFDGKEGTLTITITEESDDIPGTITIENIEYDIWAGTPRGAYDLTIRGDAIDFSGDSDLEYQDYLHIGENIEPEKEKISTVSKVDFKSGRTTVNGTPVAMTSRPYITTSGWSMIGVRDIASFFGIDEDQIKYGHDEFDVMTITITNGKIAEPGSTLVTVKNGSKILTVNGNPVIMGEAMTIGSDNRAYAPIRPIAESLGLTVHWDNATSIATFSN
ncbi:copper amine oxidase N-terminal domain-containing protein [Candidatus Epulonipiscium viviparus]|uniref:copper amine oxidase N-terminal domain-containing protein n=1 Tax=Candidatus Epulonipiscium viviparus TaxID=420336 RepID=UPI00273814F4|nr:copper amine oxidase N-terminal domain-containing protein [Candidatus Epulopiscium viviparus]